MLESHIGYTLSGAPSPVVEYDLKFNWAALLLGLAVFFVVEGLVFLWLTECYYEWRHINSMFVKMAFPLAVLEGIFFAVGALFYLYESFQYREVPK